MARQIRSNDVFGNQPPLHLMGWLGIEQERRALERLQEASLVVDYADVKHLMRAAPPGPAPKHVWELERELFGKLLPTEFQQTGDCTAVALKGAGQKEQVIQLAEQYREEKYREWFAPWIYALGRNQIGGGMNGAGSTGAWTAGAVARYGVLFADDPGVPPYSGALADSWGSPRNVNIDRAPYKPFLEIAKDNPVKIVRVNSVVDMHEMIRVYRRMMTIASNRGFKMQPVNHLGYHVFQPSGNWSHQMHVIAEMSDPFGALYRMNQWGPEAHGTPLHGETPGGAWNLDEHLDDELRGGDVEVWAYYDFSGDPSGPNLGIL